jgi:kinetochor protein Mis14/NSL1
MDSSSRKIELQASEDFTYLIDNVRRAAIDSINAAFPPVEGADGQEDELRVRIEQMVNDVCILPHPRPSNPPV